MMLDEALMVHEVLVMSVEVPVNSDSVLTVSDEVLKVF